MINHPNWKAGAIRHLLLYSFDMCIAIAGWTYGFGLHVKNWWALIGLLIVSRFVFYTVQTAAMLHEAKLKAASTSSQEVES